MTVDTPKHWTVTISWDEIVQLLRAGQLLDEKEPVVIRLDDGSWRNLPRFRAEIDKFIQDVEAFVHTPIEHWDKLDKNDESLLSLP